LFVACFHLQLISVRSLTQGGIRNGAAFVGLLAGALFLVSLGGGVGERAGVTVVLLLLYLAASWRFALDDQDRRFFALTLKAISGAFATIGGADPRSCAVRPTEETPQ
jgi:hypothetical protein